MDKATWEWHPLNAYVKEMQKVDGKGLKEKLSTGKWIALAHVAAENGDRYLVARVRD